MYERPERNALGQTLEEFLAAYHPGDWPQPSVTTDLVILSAEKAEPELLMIKRGNHPYIGCWALPGGFVEKDEFTVDTAARELEEETGVTGLTLAEVGLFSGPDRDPRNWTMTCAYTALVNRSELTVQAGDDAADSGWFTVRYAFDGRIFRLLLTDGTYELKAELEIRTADTPLGRRFTPVILDCDGIAFDHAKIITQTLLLLKEQGSI